MKRDRQALFITGTDTGVGKTRVAAAIIRALRRRGIAAAGFKPILCGPDRSDAEILLDATGPDQRLTLDQVNPCWIRQPLAPLAAGVAIDRCAILDTWESLATRFPTVVIEGAGGWEVPITPTQTFACLAREFDAPVLVVAANRLGALSQVKLTVDAIVRAGLPCAGIALNETAPPDPADPARATNRETLRQMHPGLPVWPVDWGQSDIEFDWETHTAPGTR